MTDIAKTPSRSAPRGIGGWLLVPAFATLIAPILLGLSSWESALVLAQLERARPAVRAFAAGEFLAQVSLLVGWTYALILLWNHRARYPLLFIVLSVAEVVVQVGDMLIATYWFRVPTAVIHTGDLIRGLFGCVIWIPYMLMSERVRNTFVK